MRMHNVGSFMKIYCESLDDKINLNLIMGDFA